MNADSPAPLRTGLARSLLREIAGRMRALAESGETHAIDLRGLPMTPADREELAEALGQGEVEATLRIAGESHVRETGHAGVWWLTHMGGEGEVAAEVIEICRVPEILSAHPDDIGWAARQLAETLEDGDGTEEANNGG